MCLGIKICKCFHFKLSTHMSSFQPLEVVGRGSETQVELGEKF